MTFTAPRVAAVQSERRPGRPSLNGKKKVKPRTSSSVILEAQPSIHRHSLSVNNNHFFNFGDGYEENIEESDDLLLNEKALIINSLNELKDNLNDNKDQSIDTRSIDPQMFDYLHPSLVHFQLPSPLLSPSKLNSQFVCETASRLLFLSVHWARKISVFQSLPYSTQVSLLRNCWSDLFILGLAQCKDQLSLSAVLTVIASDIQNCLGQDSLSLTRTRQLVNTLAKIKKIVHRFEELALEPEEYSYLRLCSLFGPGRKKIKPTNVTEVQNFRSNF